ERAPVVAPEVDVQHYDFHGSRIDQQFLHLADLPSVRGEHGPPANIRLAVSDLQFGDGPHRHQAPRLTRIRPDVRFIAPYAFVLVGRHCGSAVWVSGRRQAARRGGGSLESAGAKSTESSGVTVSAPVVPVSSTRVFEKNHTA